MQLDRLGAAELLDGVEVVSPFAAATEKAAFLSLLRPDAFVGDSESDVRAAAASDTPFIGVTCGQRSEAVLRAAGAEVVVGSGPDGK